jgi:hypothetical protein
MGKSSKSKQQKPWGWVYVVEGVPSQITYHDKVFIALDVMLPSQYRNVLRLLRVLNSSPRKP